VRKNPTASKIRTTTTCFPRGLHNDTWRNRQPAKGEKIVSGIIMTCGGASGTFRGGDVVDSSTLLFSPGVSEFLRVYLLSKLYQQYVTGSLTL
jgi:hypothetical protein